MKKFLITAGALAIMIPLGGCAGDYGYSSGYNNDPYYRSNYYGSSSYYRPNYYQPRRYYNGYNWPY